MVLSTSRAPLVCIADTNKGMFKGQNARTIIMNSLSIRTMLSRDLQNRNNRHLVIILTKDTANTIYRRQQTTTFILRFVLYDVIYQMH
jgi:hypothetical protein